LLEDGALRVRLAGAGRQREAVLRALLGLFGAGQRIRVEELDEASGKVVQYTSDIEGSAP
jgi:hypothetical protein